MKYLLDTNICIHLFKGQDDLENKIDAVGIRFCYLSEITIAELLYGIENSLSTRLSQNQAILIGFKQHLQAEFCESIPALANMPDKKQI